jgi:hypothetical protein
VGCSLHQSIHTKEQQLFVVANKFLIDGDVGIRKLIFVDGQWLLVLMRFPQILAFERTRERNFPLCTATQSANVALYCGTRAARSPFLAYLAQHRIRHLYSLLSDQSK